MICSLFISAFMANASNLIMKSTVFYFSYLKDSILYSVSAIFILLLNVVLISLMKSFQSWVPNSLSSSSSFFYVYMPATPLLRWAKIAVILLSVSITLLLLKNNCISLYQSLNFVWSLSNYPGSSTIFFGIPAYMFSLITTEASAGTTDISMSNLL